MKINNEDINLENIVNDIYNDKSFIKMRGNNIYLSDNDIEVLKRYNIDYKKYSSLSSLIFDLEEILNEQYDIDDLEEVSKRLSEFNYYNNTNK